MLDINADNVIERIFCKRLFENLRILMLIIAPNISGMKFRWINISNKTFQGEDLVPVKCI